MAEFNPLDHPVSLQPALRLAPSGWLEHVPFGMFLIDALRPSVLVELGTHNGVSYCAFCQAIESLHSNTSAYAIDTWKGDPQAGMYGTEVLEDLRRHHDPLYGGFSRLIQSTFDDAVQHFENGVVDLLHIDGYHTYESVRHDLETWLPKISDRGIVLLHDINVREGDFGVWQLWNELRERYPRFELLHGNGLGLLAVGEHIPPGIKTLVRSLEGYTSQLREFFFRMGQLTAIRHERQQLSEKLLEQRIAGDRAHQETEARAAALTHELHKKDRAIEEATARVAALTQEAGKKDRAIEEARAHIHALTQESSKKDRAIEEARTHVDTLTQELDKKDRAIKESGARISTLTQESGIKDRTIDEAGKRITALAAVIEQRMRANQNLVGRKPDISVHNADLSASIDEVRRHLETLLLQVDADARAAHENENVNGSAEQIVQLTERLAESERTLQEFSEALLGWERHWSGVQNSLAWRLGVQPLRRARLVIAPHGSLREKVWFWSRKMVRRSKSRPSNLRTPQPNDATVADPPQAEVRADAAPQEPSASTIADGETGKAVDQRSSIEATARVRLRMFLASGRRLRFPTAAHPRVSVVIPLLNQAHYTLMTLENLLASESEIPFEVILVDDGSTDETPQLLKQVENVKLRVHERNMGFGEACNHGAEIASSEYICFLNSDALPDAGWLSEFVRIASRSPSCGAVGGKLVLPDGRLQEAGSIIWEDGSCLGYGRDDDPLAPEYCYTREVDYCSAACLMVRRDLFLAVGSFDSRYAPAYYEDSDLCMAIRKAGHTVIFAPTVAVLHMEHGSSGQARAIALQLRNRASFVDKWKPDLVERGMPEPTQILRRRDSRTGRRLLVIDDRIPESRRGSGFPRTLTLLRALSDSGYLVTYVPADDATPFQPVTSELQEQGIEVLYGTVDVVSLLETRAHLYDAVIVSRPHNARFIEIVRRANAHVTIIYDAEAVFALRDALQAEVEGRTLSPTQVAENIRAELEPVNSADLVLTVSEVERAAIEKHCPGVPVTVWGHSLQAHPPKTGFAERRGLVFIGYMGSAPNNDAALYLLREIFPRIRQEHDLRLIIVGSDPAHQVRAEALRFNGAVTVAGYVDNLGAVLDSYRVFVAPHRFAAGIPHKVHKAMSRGVPCVISQLLADQLGVTDGVEALVAASPDDFAAKAIRLHDDEQLWQHIQQNALRLVHETCDPNIMRNNLKQWIEDSLTRRTDMVPLVP